MPIRPDLDPLVREHREDLWWYLRSLGCDGATAEDLAQETFLALMTSGFEVRNPRATFAWLKTTGRNRYISLMRRTQREVPVDGDTIDQLWTRFAPDERLAEIRAALAHCLQELTPRARETLLLRFESGHKTQQIAGQMNTRPTTVTKVLQRAKRTLKSCLERTVSDERR